MIPRLYPHSKAIREVLSAAGLTVGNHRAPKSGDGRIVAPCAVVYLVPSPFLPGSITGPSVDALIRFQVTSVDLSADGAVFYADRVAEALNGAKIVVPDRAIYRCRGTQIPGVERDDDVTPPCYYVRSEFSLVSNSEVPNG